MNTYHRAAGWLALGAALLLISWAVSSERGDGRTDVAAVRLAAASQVALSTSTVLALLAALMAGLQMRAEARRRQQTEADLRQALASVEQLVAERTDTLTSTLANLKVSEQLEDEFLATASHELRTPLNAIVGWVHVLQSGDAIDPGQREHAVSAIARNAQIQTRLIEDLLDASRMMKGRVNLATTSLDACMVVEAAISAISPAAAAKGVVLTLDQPNVPVLLRADPERLRQVVWNLLANAVKYTPRDGTIVVTVRADGDQAMIRVADDGEGIATELLPEVFAPFRHGHAPRRGGLGLGLAIAESLVALHGGRIAADSAGVGRGATFTVSLPLAPVDELAGQPPGRTDAVLDKLHVLVAEDDADSAAALTAILQRHGCETRIAPTAAECLRIAGEWRTDVLVCDIGLPDDNGYSLLQRLRQSPLGANIPAIALTAYARPDDRARALSAGFRAHLTKPLDPDAVLREIALAARAIA